MAEIVEFLSTEKPKIKAPLSIMEVEQIGFLTKTDRHLWVRREADLIKIMKFIIQEKIAIIEEE